MTVAIERVYWIGAGASVPYGLPTLKRLTWEIGESLNGEDKRIFSDAVSECFGVKLSERESPDFEEFLNRLDPLALSYLDSERFGDSRRRAGHLALSSLRSFIQNKSLKAPGGDLPFDALIRSLNDKTRLVSFNWDVLLECAVLPAGRRFTYLPSDEDKVLILKPDGSINWFALLDREGLMIAADSNLWPVGELTNYMLYVTDPLQPINFGSSSEMVMRCLTARRWRAPRAKDWLTASVRAFLRPPQGRVGCVLVTQRCSETRRLKIPFR
jgi:hypothetical protein